LTAARPLSGIRVVEMGGIGPAPFAAMLLADMGADVVRIDRPVAADLGIAMPARFDLYNRSKRSVAIDLKAPTGVDTVLKLIERADILIEGFRPGVMEKLGLGPDVCHAANARLVYGRMTGWGQTGAISATAGHDLNYIALTGALQAIGAADKPAVPLNLIGDLGGGALYLVIGALAALARAQATGQGDVVDAAMVDGVSSMMAMFYSLSQQGAWQAQRESNLLDGGAPFYGVYETKDGKHVSVGAIEGRFYRELVTLMGLDPQALPPQNDSRHWASTRLLFADVFRTRTRDEWTAIMDGSDACFSPVLDMNEWQEHPLATERGLFLTLGDVTHPAPAPRFASTPDWTIGEPPAPGRDNDAALADWGMAPEDIARLKAEGIVVDIAA
jgi:alpha-methylacyl-CoA racemase